MKSLYIALAISLPAMASEQAKIQLLDRNVTVEVKSYRDVYYDETPIWKTLEKQGWKAAKNAVNEQPTSKKLTEEINFQANLEALTSAVNSNNRSAANALLADNPDWNSCQRIQWVWLDLQNEMATGYGTKSRQKYSDILQNCPEFTLTTTQKVLMWSRKSAGPQILSQYRQSPGYDATEYSKLAYQIQLKQLSRNGSHSANKDVVVKQAKVKRDSKGAELLGWQYLKEKNYQSSLSWFDSAIKWSGKPSKKLIEGKLLSLKGLHRQKEVEQLQARWVKQYPSLNKFKSNANSERLNRICESQPAACLKLLDEQQPLTSEQHALAGWQWYKLQRPLTATRSFEKALKDLPADVEQYQETQYGYSLALNRAGFQQHAESLAKLLADPSYKVMYAKQQASKNILNAFEQEKYQYVVDNTYLYEQKYGQEVGLSEIKGWAYYNQNQNTKAVNTFQQLVNAYPHDPKFKDALKTAQCAQRKTYKQCY
ncbi:tetratricopeptide repeat protein [Photobacterium profundum]|uniref:Tetratricopeptide repeat protein n=1 Tax=Photobacterium profundum (strain SS9) TaxID=298386 RepID=Q6LKT4_PHOPR|nr:tetratricopeptide repeat protein [Photobacterium profundum]CAG22176.1 hypothetical protein PBPRB0303 [Photobacterium profundum SS9]